MLAQAASAAARAAANERLEADVGRPTSGFLATARQPNRDGPMVASTRQLVCRSLHDLRLSSLALSSVSPIDNDHPPSSPREKAMLRKASCGGVMVPSLRTQTRWLGPSNTTTPQRGRNSVPTLPMGSSQLPMVPHGLLRRS